MDTTITKTMVVISRTSASWTKIGNKNEGKSKTKTMTISTTKTMAKDHNNFIAKAVA